MTIILGFRRIDVRRHENGFITPGMAGDRNLAHVEATLEMHRGAISKSFTTRNLRREFDSIHMHLLDGPFKHLSGEWNFKQLGDMGCKILLSMDFEFRHSIISKAFERGFARVAERLVKDFCLRADDIHG